MASYYYFISSLPGLRDDQPPPYSREEFLALCERLLSRRDFTLISQLKLDSSLQISGNHTLSAWNDFHDLIRMELARSRSERLQIAEKEKYAPSRGIPVPIQDIVKKAQDAESPLEGERILIQAQYAFLDNLVANHYFDITRIIVYYLKLQIMHRSTLFDYDLGVEEFKQLLSNIKTSMKSV